MQMCPWLYRICPIRLLKPSNLPEILASTFSVDLVEGLHSAVQSGRTFRALVIALSHSPEVVKSDLSTLNSPADGAIAISFIS